MSGKFQYRAGAVVVAVLLLAGGWLLLRKPESPWRPATVAYDPECQSGCEELRTLSVPHLGEVSIYVQPAVDDPIAQWGDCLDSVTGCIREGELSPSAIAACVAASICPQPCKDTFSAEARGAQQPDEALDAFERVFIGDGAVCLPPEAGR